MYDDTNTPVLAVPAPWAKDAVGTAVSTHFETDGESLTQVVDHQTNTAVAYPVVADPIWFVIAPGIFWWAVQRCGAGGLLGAMAAYIDGNRSPWAVSAAGAVGCVSAFIGGWGDSAQDDSHRPGILTRPLAQNRRGPANASGPCGRSAELGPCLRIPSPTRPLALTDVLSKLSLERWPNEASGMAGRRTGHWIRNWLE